MKAEAQAEGVDTSIDLHTEIRVVSLAGCRISEIPRSSQVSALPDLDVPLAAHQVLEVGVNVQPPLEEAAHAQAGRVDEVVSEP